MFTIISDEGPRLTLIININADGDIHHAINFSDFTKDQINDARVSVVLQNAPLYETVSALATAMLLSLCEEANMSFPDIKVNGKSLQHDFDPSKH